MYHSGWDPGFWILPSVPGIVEDFQGTRHAVCGAVEEHLNHRETCKKARLRPYLQKS